MIIVKKNVEKAIGELYHEGKELYCSVELHYVNGDVERERVGFFNTEEECNNFFMIYIGRFLESHRHSHALVEATSEQGVFARYE